MSDTPMTDEAQFGTGRVSVDFARRLERELNAANERIKRLEEVTQERDKEWFQVIESILGFHPVSMTEALHIGIERIKKQKQRIKQLEDAGDKMAELLDCYGGFNETEEWACSTRSQHIRETRLATDAWAKAKGQP